VRFDVALMHHAILDESSFGRMMTEGVAGGTPTGDGLGVSVDMLNGHRIAGHGGNVIGSHRTISWRLTTMWRSPC